jgi:uncharacterized repeat protein (TIGR03803 family)
MTNRRVVFRSSFLAMALVLVIAATGWAQHQQAYSFTRFNGANPSGPLVADQAGNLYGATQGGGQIDSGTVFEMSPQGNGNWKETVLSSFSGGAMGGSPLGTLVIDQAGNLYGVASAGGLGCGCSVS